MLTKHSILNDAKHSSHSSVAGSNFSDNERVQKDFNIDMEINLVVQPIKLIFRPIEIEKLINFFYVEDLRPETRDQAEKLKRSLASRFNTHLKESIEMHELRKRKNKVNIMV